MWCVGDWGRRVGWWGAGVGGVGWGGVGVVGVGWQSGEERGTRGSNRGAERMVLNNSNN